MNTENRQDYTRQIVHSLRRLMQAEEHYTKELNKKFQVSTSQLVCLFALYEYGPMPPSQIAKHIMVNSSTVTGIIDRLEKKDLVKRVRSSLDRRVITINLTEAGKTLAEHAPPPIQLELVEGLKRFSEDELRQIVTALNRLAGLLDIEDHM